MPAINFDREFADAVERGRKRTTIRKPRRRPIKVGDRLFLYTGQRTANARKLKEAVCREVRDIQITEHAVCVDTRPQTLQQIECIALNDGFQSVSAFVLWFRDHYGLPFDGVEILW